MKQKKYSGFKSYGHMIWEFQIPHHKWPKEEDIIYAHYKDGHTYVLFKKDTFLYEVDREDTDLGLEYLWQPEVTCKSLILDRMNKKKHVLTRKKIFREIVEGL